MREDAEDIMRDLLQENGRLEFELTEARRETEAIERQQLQETTELEEAKDETQTMRESLCNAQETIAELELNRSHLEIHSENQERGSFAGRAGGRENVIRKIEMETRGDGASWRSVREAQANQTAAFVATGEAQSQKPASTTCSASSDPRQLIHTKHMCRLDHVNSRNSQVERESPELVVSEASRVCTYICVIWLSVSDHRSHTDLDLDLDLDLDWIWRQCEPGVSLFLFTEASLMRTRGNPLRLCSERYQKIQRLWRQHALAEVIAHAQEANQTLATIDWQHL
ncbi:hypothetical protein WMY93_029594 [Mugilogobius chulae]|uniref:Uncharacterized protein n=1 Tax=Mugilogobius chulae TaxID=88201 RepID=A0AAW0MM37_9GOBI